MVERIKCEEELARICRLLVWHRKMLDRYLRTNPVYFILGKKQEYNPEYTGFQHYYLYAEGEQVYAICGKTIRLVNFYNWNYAFNKIVNVMENNMTETNLELWNSLYLDRIYTELSGHKLVNGGSLMFEHLEQAIYRKYNINKFLEKFEAYENDVLQISTYRDTKHPDDIRSPRIRINVIYKDDPDNPVMVYYHGQSKENKDSWHEASMNIEVSHFLQYIDGYE